MHRENFFHADKWLYYINKNSEEVKKKAFNETFELITLTVSANKNYVMISELLLKNLKRMLAVHDIHTCDREFKLFIEYILKNKCIKTFFETIIKGEDKKAKELINISNLCASALVGKWLVHVSKHVYTEVFSLVIEKLNKENVAYQAKIVVSKKDYENQNELPVIVYVPSALAANFIITTGNILKSSLDELSIQKGLFFKPDIFTEMNIYHGTSNYKPYIYTFKKDIGRSMNE